MKLLKFAAIDVGSNAARLLISHVLDREKPYFKKASLIRVPLRLGFDAFKSASISDAKVDQILQTMHAYKHLMLAHNVIGYQAFATSAMRVADNGQAILKRIKSETGICLEIIAGKKEAEILSSNKITLDKNNPLLFIDVGGGSTEITLYSKDKVIASRSFEIGTIRLIKDLVRKKTWIEMENWVKKHTKSFHPIVSIGTGGNISKVFKMTGKPVGSALAFEEINAIHSQLELLSIEDRISMLNMNPDRADVITHASIIYLRVMTWAKSVEMLVPKTGLADGIIRHTYKAWKKSPNSILTIK